jgi:nucleotide-binding universal stress UspA family protein
MAATDTPVDLRHLEAGQSVNGFRLEAPLKPGGMSSLWRVTRPDIAMPLVMKIPFIRPGESPISIIGFEVEGMILPRLTGPHAPRFVEAGDFSGPYIVMEFVAGQSLKDRLDATPLPPDEVADIGARIAIALHDLHAQHVVHLDLKPSNVILRESGDVALIDFGLSRHDQLPDLIAEEVGGPIGTGPYISPEQVQGERGDPRSDLFALGVILYFLATGERPFGEAANPRDWRRRLWRDPPPPRRWNPDVPPWLQEIILCCLEVDPAARPATGAEVAFALRNPECVVLTARSSRTERDGSAKVAARWLRAHKAMPPAPKSNVAAQLARAPIVMAAVDLASGHEGLNDAVAAAVKRLFATEPGARLACINVLKTSLLGIDPVADAEGRNLHLQRLVALKHWARALRLPDERVTYHVLEAVDAAGALIDFARTNRADHIVLGARASSALRRYLGSVSAQVVAEAPCTVTVVRLPADARA